MVLTNILVPDLVRSGQLVDFWQINDDLLNRELEALLPTVPTEVDISFSLLNDFLNLY